MNRSTWIDVYSALVVPQEMDLLERRARVLQPRQRLLVASLCLESRCNGCVHLLMIVIYPGDLIARHGFLEHHLFLNGADREPVRPVV